MSEETLRHIVANVIVAGASRVTLSIAGKAPAGFPRGELLSVANDGSENRSFEVWRIVRWLARVSPS